MMPIYSIVDEDKGGVEVGFESHGYKEDGTEISEEWDKRINDYIFSHQEQFPEFFDWIDQLIDDKIQKEAELMRKEGRSEDEVRGFTLISNSLLEDDNLNVNEKYFLIVLVRYWNKDKGYAYPSYKILKNNLNITRDDKISNLIKSLEIKGYIKKEVIPGKGSKYFILKHLTTTKYEGTTEIEGTTQNEGTPPSKSVEHLYEKRRTTKTNTTTNKRNIYSNFEKEIVKLYPGKKVKSVRDKKLPKLLKECGEEKIKKCVERYAKECRDNKTEKQFILNESTFWNGRYVDYLDGNYQEIEEKRPKEKTLTHEEYLKDLYS